MKNIKLIIFILIELVLILMTRLIFINTGKIAFIINENNLGDDALPVINNLYILQSIVLFIPFLVVLILILRELFLIQKVKTEQKQKLMESSQVVEAEVEEDTTEAMLLREKLLKEEMENKKQALLQCIDEKFKTRKNKSSKATSELLLSCLANVYELTQAEIFLIAKSGEEEKLVLSATYAFYVPEEKVFEFEMGEGLIGQVAKAGEPLYLSELPQGYITVKSGLGESTPSHLAIIPWKDKNEKIFAVVEIASFKSLETYDIEIIKNLSEKISDFYE